MDMLYATGTFLIKIMRGKLPLVCMINYQKSYFMKEETPIYFYSFGGTKSKLEFQPY